MNGQLRLFRIRARIRIRTRVYEIATDTRHTVANSRKMFNIIAMSFFGYWTEFFNFLKKPRSETLGITRLVSRRSNYRWLLRWLVES